MPAPGSERERRSAERAGKVQIVRIRKASRKAAVDAARRTCAPQTGPSNPSTQLKRAGSAWPSVRAANPPAAANGAHLHKVRQKFRRCARRAPRRFIRSLDPTKRILWHMPPCEALSCAGFPSEAQRTPPTRQRCSSFAEMRAPLCGPLSAATNPIAPFCCTAVLTPHRSCAPTSTHRPVYHAALSSV